jgi:hypothetical protein
MALCFSALILAGTMALSDTHIVYSGWPVLSVLFFGLASALGSLLFLSLVRSKW